MQSVLQPRHSKVVARAMPELTNLGKCLRIVGPLCILLIIGGQLAEEQAYPTGDVGIFYSVPLCYVSSITIPGRGIFDEYSMRPFTTTPDDACPAAFNGSAAPIEISLEAVDGYRMGAVYNPVFVVPTGSYMYVTMSTLDAAGSSVMNVQPGHVSLGPDQLYPWTSDSTAPAAAPAAGNSGSMSTSSSSGSACSETCRYASDGDCDDGGPGGEYSSCEYGSDCTDCGSRPPMGRLLSHAPVDVPFLGSSDSSAAGARRLLAFPAPSDEEAEEEAMPVLAAARAGARRLLKGGSSGYGGSAGGGGSSYSSRGSSRFGGASSTVTSRSAPRSTATVTSGSRTYGGRSAYVVGGTTYYGASSYSYYHGPRAYPHMAMFYVVGPWGYGCYSCHGAYRNCYSCGGCYNRQECGGGRDQALTGSTSEGYDRYELDLSVQMPSDDASPPFPLKLRVSAASLYFARSSGVRTSAAVYVTMYTNEGEQWLSIKNICERAGPIGLVICILIFFCNRNQMYKNTSRPSNGPRARQPLAMAYAYPEQPVAMAVPMATAQPYNPHQRV